MAKYHNKKTVSPDGIKFDSRRECQRWGELRLLERAGRISNLERQVKFELIPAQYEAYERYSPPNWEAVEGWAESGTPPQTGKRLKDGRKCVELATSYVADFVYIQDGQRVVEDVKSKATKTPEYIIKRKLMLWLKGIKIREIE
jgi:hypothetical protein